MVRFETQVYQREGNSIVGAEVIVLSDAGDRIRSIIITDETDYNELVERIEGLSEECVTFNDGSSLAGETIETILANLTESTTINATQLGGFQSDQYTKVGHTHTKNAITNLYNYDLSISDYNPNINSEVTITVKVTKQNNSSVPNTNIILKKDGETWKTGTTNSNGVYTAKFTPTEVGLVTFAVQNQKVQLLAKDTWKTIYSGNNIILQNKEDKVRLFYDNSSPTSLTGSWKDLHTFSDSFSEYMPSNVHVSSVVARHVIFRVTTDGKLQVASFAGNQSIGMSARLEWTI